MRNLDPTRFSLSSKQTSLIRGIGVVALAAFWWLGHLLGQEQDVGDLLSTLSRLSLRCPLLLLSGIHCPTCGFGRSLLLAWTGHWKDSLLYHPAGVIVLVGLTIIAILEVPFPGTTFRIWFWLKLFPRSFWLSSLLLYTVWGFLRELPSVS